MSCRHPCRHVADQFADSCRASVDGGQAGRSQRAPADGDDDTEPTELPQPGYRLFRTVGLPARSVTAESPVSYTHLTLPTKRIV